MNALRRFDPLVVVAGCLALALVSASSFAQSPGYPRASNSKLKAKTVAERRAVEAVESEDVFAEPPQEVRRRSSRPSYTPVGGPRRSAAGFVPRHQRVAPAQFDEPVPEALPAPTAPRGMGVPAAEEPMPEMNGPESRRTTNSVPRRGAPMMMEEQFEGEMPFGGDPFDAMGGGCADGACGNDCGPYTDCFPCFKFTMRDLDIYSGVQGFTNSTNRAGSGSFGYTFGFNKGRPLHCFPCTNLAMQIGVAGTFSNFDGATFTNNGALAATTANRNQMFLTWGLFRRADWGLQFGMVFDYLHEDWYVQMDVAQLRGELSWVYPENHEIGFTFAANVNPGNDIGSVLVAGAPVAVTENWESADLYAFFYRYRSCESRGEMRYFAGFTGDGDGLIGSEYRLPISDNWSVQADYTYLLPADNGGAFATATANESWNLAINMVWSPGSCRNFGPPSYNRPLFNVANNGNFILKRR